MPGRRRKVANPLALAILVTLRQGPMHPYEMAATMRAQGKERSIKLNYGSLYTVVDNLAKNGMIEPIEATREGRRPERTVYRLTSAGQDELEDWLADLLANPVKEYPHFEAALAEMAALPPDRVLELLRLRVHRLEQALADERAELARFPWLPRLFLVEAEYHLAMREAELSWVRGIVAEFDDGSFPRLAEWAHWHEAGELPADVAAMSTAALDQAMSEPTGDGPAPAHGTGPAEGAEGGR